MNKQNGMSYAPKGKPNKVVNKDEFRFSAIGLDHGHIYGMCNGLLEAGATLVSVYDPDPKKSLLLLAPIQMCKWLLALPIFLAMKQSL